MRKNILLMTVDEEWERFMTDELAKRGFRSIMTYGKCVENINPDSVLLDVSDYDENMDSQVRFILEKYPLCEWLLFFSGHARWGDVSVISRRAYEIVSKSANMDRVAIYILAACMKKIRAEERLKSLE